MQTPHEHLTLFVIASTIVVFALSLMMMILFFRFKRRQIKHEHEIENLKLVHEKSILTTQIEIQEQTFQNISRDIHDHINLSLTLAKLNLNMLDWNDVPAAKGFVQSSIDILSQSINSLRNLSRSLNSDLLHHLGLIDALSAEVNRVKATTLLHLHMHVSGEQIFLESEKETVIFRIVQESFNNIIKHAKATQVWLEIRYEADQVGLSVRDDGVGLSRPLHELMYNGQCSGLLNMQQRARAFGGEFQLRSSGNTGTEIFITIPYTCSKKLR